MKESAPPSPRPAYLAALLPPLWLLLLGVLPGSRFLLFSGHGGIGWLILPLCLPYVALMLALRIRNTPPPARRSTFKRAAATILVYILAAFPLSELASRGFKRSFGLETGRHQVFRLAIFPIGLLLPPAAREGTQDVAQ